MWVTWEAPIAAAALVDSISCFGENDGSIVLQALSGGAPPYAYSIDGQNYTSTNIFQNLSAGMYTLRVRDGGGCLWQSAVTLVEPPELSVRLFASDTVIQRGRLLNLEAVPEPQRHGTSVPDRRQTRCGPRISRPGSTPVASPLR